MGRCRVTCILINALSTIPQVIGPNSTPYHKPCLACVACNKRLDSTLLVEHDGLPVCRNCHRSHLGQGKGGFGKAVPIKAQLPNSPPRRTANLADESDELDLTAKVSGISISARPSAPRNVENMISSGGEDGPEPVPQAPLSDTRSTAHSSFSNIDELVGSRSEVPTVRSRDPVLQQHMDSVTRSVNGSDAIQDSHYSDSPASSIPQPPARPTKPSTLATTPQDRTLPTSPSTPSSSASTTGQQSGSSPAVRRLPSPVRRTPINSPASNYKTATSSFASPRSPVSAAEHSSPFRNQYTSPNITPTRLGNAIGSGTPLCARCSKPAYFAEAVTGATTGGRVWHRACLKCESCGTTLKKGTLEEGPSEEAAHHGEGMNTFCKLCYKKLFGPRGIGNAGTSFPTMSR